MQSITHQHLTTRVKAKNLNEDKNIYGTFAEIGAGQEVAAAFFKAGGASRTIAKTMSAYDMTFSDIIYGKEKSGRYVIENRLNKMLEREFTLLEKRIGDQHKDSRFFVFANTVATKSRKTGRPGHGWLGCMYQLKPKGPVHKIVIHIHLYETLVESQQNLIGVLGVNLLYGAYRCSDNIDKLIKNLQEGLEGRKFHIDVLRLEGESFNDLDNRSINLKLLSQGLGSAILFDAKGNVCSLTDTFYNQSILVARGRFRPPTLQTRDMLKIATAELEKLSPELGTLPICELTYNHMISDESISEEDFLFRLDMITAMKLPTLVTNFEYHYRLSEYLSLFHTNQLAFVVGIDNLEELFKEEHYYSLPGGILEAMGRLFKNKFRMFLYPRRDEQGNTLKGSQINLPEHLNYLFKHLWCQNLICDLKSFDPNVLGIYSEDVLDKFRSGDDSWEKLVPGPVAQKIIEYKDFIANQSELS